MKRWLILAAFALGCEQVPAPAPAPVSSTSASEWVGPDRPGPWGALDVSCMFNKFGSARSCLVCAVREGPDERVLCWVVRP